MHVFKNKFYINFNIFLLHKNSNLFNNLCINMYANVGDLFLFWVTDPETCCEVKQILRLLKYFSSLFTLGRSSSSFKI